MFISNILFELPILLVFVPLLNMVKLYFYHDNPVYDRNITGHLVDVKNNVLYNSLFPQIEQI